MTYAVNEMFYTLQGEGRNAGRAAVFCRGEKASRNVAVEWSAIAEVVA